MNLKQLVAQGSIAGVLAVGAVGAAPVAGADPDWDDWEHYEWVDDGWNDREWRFDSDWEWKQVERPRLGQMVARQQMAQRRPAALGLGSPAAGALAWTYTA
jgi:hypothetical protein